MNTDHVRSVASKVESLVFLHGEPLTVSKLSAVLSEPGEVVEEAIEILTGRHAAGESGLRIVRVRDAVELVTSPENAETVEAMLVADREETLGKATMETLAVVAYRGPVTRAAIDAIRGVNSSFALRNLSLRGLVDRRPNPLDAREFEYVPSFRLFELLGIGSAAELPGFAELTADPRLAEATEGDSGDGDAVVTADEGGAESQESA